MDPARYAIRPFVDADFGAEARISIRLNPQPAVSVAKFRRWDRVLGATGLVKRPLTAQ